LNESKSNEIVANLPQLAQEKGGTHLISLKTGFEDVGESVLKCTWPPLLFVCWYLCTTLIDICSGAPVSFVAIIGCVIGALFFGSFLGLLFLTLKRDFVLRQWGITLPAIYWLASPGRLSWSWSQLVKVVFSKSDPAQKSADQIVLGFVLPDSSETIDIHIKLKELEQLDLKKLVYAIVTNASHAVIEPPLEKVALELPTVSGMKHINFQSFTNLWNEEFSTRYSPTLFVPLSPGEGLRNGSITITELVACGGSAAIYSAKTTNGEQIIVKEAVIPKNSPEALKTKAIELFNREALLLSKLDHPHIAKVFDHFVEKEHHYEVLEYIDGLDLRRFVKERGPQPEDFVLNWAEQICEILVYLHSQVPPVIHRDLTPDNLVLRVDGQLVLIDFGAANAFVGTATGTMVGKQSYMPPEQLRGKSVPQSDIYSLGGTCYFLLTGKDPTPLEESQVSVESGLPMNLNPLLAKCTAGEISDRYSSAHEVLIELRRIRQQRALAASAAIEGSA
jgi:tRNA A-37 threonylcarbamoyl transferase component Bud32